MKAKYADQNTQLVRELDADLVMLLVIGGKDGDGFSVSMRTEGSKIAESGLVAHRMTPDLLRVLASAIWPE